MYCSGHGFVQFERIEDAQRAIAELNGKPFGSKNMSVMFRFLCHLIH